MISMAYAHRKIEWWIDGWPTWDRWWLEIPPGPIEKMICPEHVSSI